MLQDLKDFIEKVKEDEALQERMGEIVKSSEQEDIFDNCNAVAAEMGYTIVEDDMKALADEYQAELGDEELDEVAGGVVSLFTSLFAVWELVSMSVASVATSAAASASASMITWNKQMKGK